MIRIVLDTNVFVSGLFWTGSPYQILCAWQAHKIQFIFTSEIMDEYKRVSYALAEKHHFSGQLNVGKALELVAIHGEMTSPIKLEKQISRDPDDDKFIACALGSNCKKIVSGDKDLLDISGIYEIAVLKPGDFVNQYL